MLVYKYVVPDRTDVLEGGMLRFTQAQALNDPFETYPSFGDLERSLIQRQLALIDSLPATIFVKSAAGFLVPSRVRNSLKDFRRTLSSQFLILSLTKKRNNLVMWSHYARFHRGFVIGFDSESEFFHANQSRMITPLTEVSYSEKRPVLPAFDDFEKRTNELAEIIIFNKSIHWSYEEELRMVAHSSGAQKQTKADDGSDCYLFACPAETLKEIVIGLATPNDVKDKIKSIVRERFPGVETFETRLSDTQFDLTIVPV